MSAIKVISLRAKIGELVQELLSKNPNSEKIKKLINEMPKIRADPAKHGRWLIDDDGYYCQCCEEEPIYGVLTDVCPNCGAKMDLKDGENNA